MNTDQLIASLSQSVPAIPRHALLQRIRYGLYGGGVIASLLVVGWLGLRPDLPSAVRSFAFWMKWTYTISIGIAAVFAVVQLARPTPASLRSLWLLAIPVALLAGIGVEELAGAPEQEWQAMWLGRSSTRCPWIVAGLAMPMLLGLFWSFRKFAPRRTRAAGAAAGLAAGAWAATIYCLHCPESSAIFVLTWYSLGMALAAVIGALLGPKFMRW